MAVAGNDQVSPAGYGALQDPVIGWVFGNHLQGDLRADNLGDFDDEFELRHDVRLLPFQIFPENACDFTQDIGGDEQDETAAECLLPNPKRRALVGKRREVDVGIQHHSKLVCGRGSHGRCGLCPWA